MSYNLEDVLPLGVLTGSRAFKCATEDSDWDIVLTRSNFPAQLPDTHIISSTNFNTDSTVTGPNGYRHGHDVSEFEEFEDEPFVEYDQHTIWGPLEQIIKYTDMDGTVVNLFVYQDKHKEIISKFVELNNLMCFLHNTKLVDREYRIKAFSGIIKQVGITDFN